MPGVGGLSSVSTAHYDDGKDDYGDDDPYDEDIDSCETPGDFNGPTRGSDALRSGG